MKRYFKKLDTLLLPPKQRYRYSPYAWLIYLFFFFVSFFANSREPYQYPLMLLGVVVFLFLYFRLFWISQVQVKYYLILMALHASIMTLLTQGASVFFVYVGAFCCRLGSPKKAIAGIALLLLWVVTLSYWFKLSPYFYLPAIVFSTFIGFMNIYQFEIDKKNKALDLSQQEVRQLAQTAERERIARDLHDLIGHTFSVLTLKADLAGKLIDRDPQRAKQEVKELENLSRDALSQVREVVSGFRSADIKAELAATKYLLQSNDIDFDYQLSELNIDEQLNKELALMIKELTTNVLKHANATKVSAAILVDEKGLQLNYIDNGIGIKANQNKGFGLKGIAERLQQWHGELSIGNTDKGCKVMITIATKWLGQGA